MYRPVLKIDTRVMGTYSSMPRMFSAGKSLGGTVNSHNLNSQNLELRVSNPRTIAYLHLELPSESSNPPRAGPLFLQIELFENRPRGDTSQSIGCSNCFLRSKIR